MVKGGAVKSEFIRRNFATRPAIAFFALALSVNRRLRLLETAFAFPRIHFPHESLPQVGCTVITAEFRENFRLIELSQLNFA